MNRSGPVAALHESAAASVSSGTQVRRLVSVLEPDDTAVVLGSTQRPDIVDQRACDAAQVRVVRRRSGGGAVLVGPGEQLWVDIVVPRDDPLWSVDVGTAAWWVGEAWAHALAAAGLHNVPQVWKAPFQATKWSELVCFAGRGAGEVFSASGRKLVGVSQRRSRSGALFQCSCLLRWEPVEIVSLLALPGAARVSAARDLREVAAAVPAPPGLLLEALLASLP